MENTSPATIKNNHDHTNLLAVREYVDDLVKYCFGIYASFQKTQAEEEQRNERLKLEYREYQFRKSYGAHCNVTIYGGGQHTDFKDYASFQSALLGGMILELDYLQISLNLSHYVGKFYRVGKAVYDLIPALFAPIKLSYPVCKACCIRLAIHEGVIKDGYIFFV